MELLMTVRGVVRAIYTELLPLHEWGELRIDRASHVEPTADGQWWADLAPSQGPVLGPFVNRSSALQAEHDWLTKHVLFGEPTEISHQEPIPNDKLPSPEELSSAPPGQIDAIKTSAGSPDLF